MWMTPLDLTANASERTLGHNPPQTTGQNQPRCPVHYPRRPLPLRILGCICTGEIHKGSLTRTLPPLAHIRDPLGIFRRPLTRAVQAIGLTTDVVSRPADERGTAWRRGPATIGYVCDQRIHTGSQPYHKAGPSSKFSLAHQLRALHGELQSTDQTPTGCSR